MNGTAVVARVAGVLLLASVGTAQTAEIRLWTARAITTVLAQVGPDFERETGHRVSVTTGLPNDFAKLFAANETPDLIISGPAPIDQWIKEGKIHADSRMPIARSGIGVEVRAGARKPDISSVEAFKRALLEAKSIAYLRVGSGAYLAGMLDRIGVAETIKPKVIRPETDIVSELVAKGEVELGMVVITQILTTPGVELVGPLPAELQWYNVFTAGIHRDARAPQGAQQLIRFLQSPKVAAVIRAQGMETIP